MAVMVPGPVRLVLSRRFRFVSFYVGPRPWHSGFVVGYQCFNQRLGVAG